MKSRIPQHYYTLARRVGAIPYSGDIIVHIRRAARDEYAMTIPVGPRQTVAIYTSSTLTAEDMPQLEADILAMVKDHVIFADKWG